ncbi:MAG: heterodisulfide reductase-related iron-sulfur binding cluster [Vicinamibacteria bacterium]
MTERRISYLPTDGLSYDPEDEHYWEPKALDKEISRAFEICHGCRMCFKYCDSFPTLFDLLDNRYDGDVHKVDSVDTKRIMNACFQCKLCEVQCPYTPGEGHEFQLDFPRLVHRYQAVASRTQRRPLRDKLLANPDGVGRMARASRGMVNVMNRSRTHRWFMEKVLGIHREKLLPEFPSTTFERWAEKEGRIRSHAKGDVPETVLFQTCYVQNSEPQIGRDTLEVMDRNGVATACVRGLQCCGMPAWETGDLETTRRQALTNLDILMPFVESGAKVLAINPTCAMMMRREYPDLLPREQRERAKKLSHAVRDPSEYLWSIREQSRFNTNFKSTPGPTVSYHVPCHLRAQKVGVKARDLLRKIPGVKPTTTLECCGHDGTHAMKIEGFEYSRRVGRKAFEGMASSGASVWVTDCPLAALQFQQHAGVKPMHPMSVLARAYRGDGFSVPVETE